MTTKEAIEHLTKELETDEGYRETWQANIAMAFKDQWQWTVDKSGLPCTPEHIHEIANKAASYFINSLCRDN